MHIMHMLPVQRAARAEVGEEAREHIPRVEGPLVLLHHQPATTRRARYRARRARYRSELGRVGATAEGGTPIRPMGWGVRKAAGARGAVPGPVPGPVPEPAPSPGIKAGRPMYKQRLTSGASVGSIRSSRQQGQGQQGQQGHLIAFSSNGTLIAGVPSRSERES